MRSELDLPDLSRLTLLAVDDNADALEVLGTILKACGADVLEARDGRDALAYVDTTPGLDAIITDLSMPGMDGVEFARKVREQPSRGGLPVIALTGFPERQLDTSAFDAFLKKPFEFDELCRVVHSLTAARNGHQQYARQGQLRGLRGKGHRLCAGLFGDLNQMLPAI